MAEIPVWTLIPSSGAVPSELYDPVSQAGYTESELDDEARFGIVVPDCYLNGSDFFLRLHESSSSESAKHKWQVTALLFRPGVHATDEQDDVETSAYEFESAAVSDQLSTRICTVTGLAQAGHIGDVEIWHSCNAEKTPPTQVQCPPGYDVVDGQCEPTTQTIISRPAPPPSATCPDGMQRVRSSRVGELRADGVGARRPGRQDTGAMQDRVGYDG